MAKLELLSLTEVRMLDPKGAISDQGSPATHARKDRDWSQGLNDATVKARRLLYGPNEIPVPGGPKAWQRLWAQIKNPMVLLLIAASFLSFAMGELSDGIAILTIIALNAALGFAQEQKADQAIAALKAMSQPRASVIRNGQTLALAAAELVPDDIIILEAGDSVPADATLLEARSCWVDEAMLTGESLPVEKKVAAIPAKIDIQPALADEDTSTRLFSGTALAKGSAIARITATGAETRLGQMAALMQATEKAPTPLQLRMEEASRLLLGLAGLIILGLVAFGIWQGQAWRMVLLGALSLAVAAIPEGLPSVVTIALALAVRRMSARNAIVRHLPSVETLGSCDVICSDKTGTLTLGRMELAALWDAKGQRFDSPSWIHNESLRPWFETAVLASTASYSQATGGVGDTTEIALLKAAEQAGIDLQGLRKRAGRGVEWSFDSQRKRMSLAYLWDEATHVCVKGAPESLLPLCQLSSEAQKFWHEETAKASAQGLRLLALARKTMAQSSRESLEAASQESIEHGLEWIGLAALADPPRPESKAAIAACKKAGIKINMITGDHPLTAEAIARNLGILEPNETGAVLSGSELDRLSDEELKSQVSRVKVYARVSPEHKLRIINAWKHRASIVAMTGDGVNDAPALKAANLGIAMGCGGTEVARQASALILSDDHFATIVAAIEEGRQVYGNIKRTITYLLTGNFAEICVVCGAMLAGLPFPLWPIHLLWINLVTDGLPSLALAAEPSQGTLGDKPSQSSFFDRAFYLETLLMGLSIAVIGLWLYRNALETHGLAEARTILFTFIVAEELFRSFAARSATVTFLSFRLQRNTLHLISVLVPLLLQGLILQTQAAQALFKVAPVPQHELIKVLLWALLPVTLLELGKWARYSQKPSP